MSVRRPPSVAVGLAVAVAALALAGCSSGPETPDEQVLRVAVPASPGSFDAFGGLAADQLIGGAVYDTLLHATHDDILTGGTTDDSFEPWLAESFEYTEDRTVLTFVLRDDVDFVDGEHFDAEALKANLEVLRGPDGPQKEFFAAIEEVTVTGEYELELRLSRADADLLYWVGVTKGIISPASVSDREGLTTEPVGSGPYVLESNNADTEYVFVRNEDYWNPEAFDFDRIEVQVMPDVTARINALKSGQIDLAPIDLNIAEEAENSGLGIHYFGGIWGGLVLGDHRGEISPPIADVRVRHAIAMAMDRVGYAEAIGAGYADPSNQIGYAGQEGFYVPDLAEEDAYDIEAARELLAEAGYPDGFDITIPYLPSYTGQFQPYFEQAFADLGIRVDWKEITGDEFVDAYFAGKYAVVPVRALIEDLSFVKPDGVWNSWHNQDPETDEILEAINSGSGEDRIEARERLTSKIVDEAWFAVLAHEPSMFAYNTAFTVDPDAGDNIMLFDIRVD